MPITLFLCGDVMTGRGIDQVLPHSVDPELHEPYVKDAEKYVLLAERSGSNIPDSVGFDYIWGDALTELRKRKLDLRIINLETSVTTSDDYWRGKGIHYRMHPGNAPVLAAAGIDAAVLANNHVLDWGYDGLEETVAALRAAGVEPVGAGEDLAAARAPAEFDFGDRGTVKIYAFGHHSSGVFPDWAADEDSPGVWVLEDLSGDEVDEVKSLTADEADEIVVASIHWGGNWGYDIPEAHREFAHRLIDEAGVDVVYGHSSHHVKGIEVHSGRLILYGCGDFLNDYEGISGHEEYRPELTLMYFPELAADGSLERLRMVPLRIADFRLNRPSAEDAAWLQRMLNREGKELGTRVRKADDGSLLLEW